MTSNPKIRVRNYLSQDRFIRLSRELVKKLGTEPAIFISELIDWEGHLENKNLLETDGSFYFEQKFIEERTGMSPYIQRVCRNTLEKNGLLRWERKGVPPKYYYSMNHEKIEEILLSNDSQRLKSLTFVDKVLHSIEDKEPNRKEPKVTSKSEELRSSNLSITPVPETGTTLIDTPSLIKRRRISTVEFEKIPRQRYNGPALDILNYWNNSPGLVKHGFPPVINGRLAEPTKTFIKAIATIEKVLSGKFFTSVGLSGKDRVYTKEEIITAIDRFKLMATNPNYLPVEKSTIRHVGISSFFYNPYSNHIPSNFLKCLEEEPKPVVTVIEKAKEKNPQLTQWLKETYVEKILFGVNKEFNAIDDNKFIRGANHLHELIRRLQGKLNMMTRPIEWCQMVIDALIDRWGREGIYVGHLASEYTYNDTLVRYLKRKGRLD